MIRYSYALVTLAVMVLGLAYTVVSGDIAVGGVITLVLSAILMIYFVLARRGLPSPANAEKRLRKALSGGRPVVVCFFSDFHIGSLLMRPLVAPVERDFRSRCDFIYINMNHPQSDHFAETLEADVGDFVVYDRLGNQVETTQRITAELLQGLL